jgi:hypothetical protein
LPLTAAAVAILLLVLGLELIATAYLYATEGRFVAARDRFASKTNTFVDQLTGGDGTCGYVDTLYPHPYVGFVHHGNAPCGVPTINNIGLFGPDFPSRRPDDRFVVLLTGGSVASQFALGVSGGPSYLERFLNDRYVSPTGRPFLVLNGADGAWKQPQQAILFLLYADAVHAVVTLDGFNEHYQMRSGYRFEYPANNFHSVNPTASQNFADMVARWAVGRVRMAAARNALLSRSQAAYSIISAVETWAQRRAESRPKPKTTVETMFLLPSTWSAQDRQSWQMAQYHKYIGAMTATARDHDVLPAYFVQPCPALDKPLSTEERRVVGDLGYAATYREMTEGLLVLKARGTPIVSLLDVFRGDTRTLYGDPIHLVRDEDGRSAGYERIADRMATELGALWRLQRK